MLKRRFPSLFARVVFLVAASFLLVVTGLAILARQAIVENVDRTLQERLVIARVTAARFDDMLERTVDMLRMLVSEQKLDPQQPDLVANRQGLEQIRQHLGDLAYYVALVDEQGVVVLTEPYLADVVGSDLSDGRCIQKILHGTDWVISKVFTVGNTNPTAAILVEIDGANGKQPGLVYVGLNLGHTDIAGFLQPIGLGETGYADIVDENGITLASSRPEHLWQQIDHGERFASLIREDQTMVGTCHNCHSENWAGSQGRQEDVIAFAPLALAPWGVVVRQSQAEAMAYTKVIEYRILFFAGGAFLIAVLLAWLATQALVKPLQALSAACQRIAAGDLSEPIPPMGSGEIQFLAQAFDGMRQQLQASLEKVAGWNRELEKQVRQRTGELERAERQRRELLRKLVVSQEDERRRLARELHDETSQALTAVAVGLETILVNPTASAGEIKENLGASKELVASTLSEIQRIILDLRPAILDDLGLVQAIDWYAESRLKSQGIWVMVETIGEEKRLPSEVETTLFRVAQEAITNIVRHAGAENVTIELGFAPAGVTLQVEDDGCGFDVTAAVAREKNVSFGLLGMRERAALFGGTVEIESQPDHGTRLTVELPLERNKRNGRNGRNGKNGPEDPGTAGRRPRHPERGLTGAPESF